MHLLHSCSTMLCYLILSTTITCACFCDAHTTFVRAPRFQKDGVTVPPTDNHHGERVGVTTSIGSPHESALWWANRVWPAWAERVASVSGHGKGLSETSIPARSEGRSEISTHNTALCCFSSLDAYAAHAALEFSQAVLALGSAENDTPTHRAVCRLALLGAPRFVVPDNSVNTSSGISSAPSVCEASASSVCEALGMLSDLASTHRDYEAARDILSHALRWWTMSQRDDGGNGSNADGEDVSLHTRASEHETAGFDRSDGEVGGDAEFWRGERSDNKAKTEADASCASEMQCETANGTAEDTAETAPHSSMVSHTSSGNSDHTSKRRRVSTASQTTSESPPPHRHPPQPPPPPLQQSESSPSASPTPPPTPLPPARPTTLAATEVSSVKRNVARAVIAAMWAVVCSPRDLDESTIAVETIEAEARALAMAVMHARCADSTPLPRVAALGRSAGSRGEESDTALCGIDADGLVCLLGEQDDALVQTMLRLLQLERELHRAGKGDIHHLQPARRLLAYPGVAAVVQALSRDAVFEVRSPHLAGVHAHSAVSTFLSAVCWMHHSLACTMSL
jgi:hypothetical protein